MDTLALTHHHHPFAFHPDLYSMGVPVLIAIGLPWLAVRLLGKLRGNATASTLPYTRNLYLLWLAAFAWFWAIQLPNIAISSQTESTTMHFIGGCVIAPTLGLYALRGFGVQLTTAGRRISAILASVVIFGIVNEIAEYKLDAIKPDSVETSDTAWDLGTNLVGALVAIVAVELFLRWRKQPAPVTQ